MHPKALLDACTELVRLILKFDHPADAVVSKFFRDHRRTYAFGPRERASLAETVYNVLRFKLRYDHFAPSGSGPKERRLAILGFAQHLQDSAAGKPGALDFLKDALFANERTWLDNCLQIQTADLLERHRHNLPEWLVQPLKAQLGQDGGQEFWALVDSFQHSATLDLRVNSFTDKRADVQKEL
jgi:16S rRNA (cytosine967-C5)-methyltransferase